MNEQRAELIKWISDLTIEGKAMLPSDESALAQIIKEVADDFER